jgi:hypothetical protein
MSVSKMRSIAANGNSRVIPAQAGIQWLSPVARTAVRNMRSTAAKNRRRRRALACAQRVGQRGRPQGLPLSLPSVPAQAGIQG